MSYPISKYKPVRINTPTNKLSEEERQVIDELVKVGKIFGRIYEQQMYARNDESRKQAEALGEEALLSYKHMAGPFNKMDHNKAFIEGHKKPLGANFYPEDMTKEEFQSHLKEHPEDEESFTSEYTLIRRDDQGKIKAIPYSEAYTDEILEAQKHLEKALEITTIKPLNEYLTKLSEALKKNDYFESDIAWMNNDSRIQPTMGPYEVYEDELFGYKASFEAVIGLLDKEETDRLNHLEDLMTEMDENLPVKTPFPRKGKHSPIVVIDTVFSAGDARAGFHASAYNLPNDERVREAKGSKKTMIKNVMDGKYDHCSDPIMKIILDEKTYSMTGPEYYFLHVVLHEMSHGIGPGFIEVDGKKTTVSKALKDAASGMEELKADVLGLYNAYFLAEKGIIEKDFADKMFVTSQAMNYRSLRFGLNEAHAIGNIIQLNYFKENDAITYDEKTKKYNIDPSKAKEGLTELATKILTIQAAGDYDKAKEFIKKYRVVTPDIKNSLELLKDVPIDIRLVYDYD